MEEGMKNKVRNVKHIVRKRKGICILGIAFLVIAGIYIGHENSHVRFEDKNMGIVICNTIGEGVTPETVRYKDLKKVTKLKVGFVGFYSTIEDIKKCKRLELLDMNSRSREQDASYAVTGEEIGRIRTPEEVEQLQNEFRGNSVEA